MNTLLKKYGLNEKINCETASYDGLFAARVTEQHREIYKVVSDNGELEASVSGKFAYNTNDQTAFPAVGDWVMIDRVDKSAGNAVIHHVLERKSILARQSSGSSSIGQIIAANIDTIFICMSLNSDFNLRRIERYLTIAWDSMATPVIILTKSDLCNNLPQKLNEISSASMGVDIIACSFEQENGYEEIKRYIVPGRTVAFVGSSGVGKSTIINALMGQNILATKSIRGKDDKGRHTTTHRQLLLLPSGGIVIDTPGMRELQIYAGDLSKTFADIEEIAAKCRFNDCTHKSEPGCAIQDAIKSGILDEKRYESYQKLQREMEYTELNSRQLENEKIERMFGSKNEMKNLIRQVKNRKHR